MRELYPEIEPYRTERFAVGDGHTLHVEECGNPGGLPVVFLHGGPGAGLSPYHRRFFDPARWRVVLFDQRGAGQSTPFASLDDRRNRRSLGLSPRSRGEMSGRTVRGGADSQNKQHLV